MLGSKSTKTRATVVSLVLLGLACATANTLPAFLTNPREHPRYPSSAFVTAVGMSAQSQNAAENDAKVKVAEQVRSSIEGAVVSVEGVVTSNGQTKDFQRVLSEVRSRTVFKRAEMIQIDYQSTREIGGQWYVFAFLSRRDFYQSAVQEYETAAAVFRGVAPTLPALQDDVSAFSPAYRRAQQAFKGLIERDVEIHAISGKDYERFREDSAAYLAIADAREKVLRGLRITVNVERTDRPEAREVILMALTGALTRLGLEATPGVCGPQLYELAIAPRIECRSGPFGPQCALSMTGTFIHCASRRSLAEIDLSNKRIIGVDTHDEARAIVRLYRNITPDSLLPSLSKALSPVLPIDEVEDRQESEREVGS